MKNIYAILIVLAALYIDANSQVVPSIKSATLINDDKAVIDQHLSKYNAFTIDKDELTDKLYSNKGAGEFRLRINEELDWTISLEFNDMRAPGYKRTVVLDKGVVEDEFKLNTFKGKTSDGKIVRLTIDENNFFGVIIDNKEHYVIRPTNDITKNSKDKSFIVYKNSDIIISDYINDVLLDPIDHKNGLMLQDIMNDSNKSASSSPCALHYLKMAIDADYEFYQKVGSNSNSYIFSTLNIVEGVIEPTFGLKFMITYQNVWTTTSGAYPYTTGGDMLYSLAVQYWWTISQAQVSRNHIHLFTGKPYGGAAHQGQLDDPNNPAPYSYAVAVSGYDGPITYSVVAHELGHSLGAGHIPPQFVNACMCSDPNNLSIMCGTSTMQQPLWYCDHSINEISTVLNNNLHKLECVPSLPCISNFSNQTVTNNTTINGCSTLTVQNVTVTNNAKLTINSGGVVTFSDFNLVSGQLET